MEDRGWIYYRKGGGTSGALGSAFLDVQAMLEPGKRHVIEMKVKQQDDADDAGDNDSGDPPIPGK